MKFTLINDIFGDYKNSCKYVANEIEKQLNNKPNSTFILPTGSTPMGVYDELSERDLDWSKATTYNLDEYLNCPIKEQTYKYFMDEMLFNNINIKRENIKVTFEGDRCFYSPGEHLINMVELSRFSDSEEYYATYLHEAIHSTKKTLKRDLQSRGLEELVAEMGALLLCKEHFKINCDYLNHVSYLNSWIKNLKENPKVLFKMLGHASKASKFFIDGESKK